MVAVTLACMVGLPIPGALLAQQGGGDVLNIGSRLELFVDDYLIDTMAGVTQELHSPQRQNIAIVFDKPWERLPSAPKMTTTSQPASSRT